MKLKEKFIRRLKDIKGKAVGFRIDEVRLPDQGRATREYLHHPGAVAAIAVIAPGQVIMVRQYRYPVAQQTWEIPAGKLHKGEDPLKCVARELEEETGYRPGRLRKLIAFWPTAAFANEVIHMYVADRLKPGTLQPDADEFLTTRVWKVEDLLKEIRGGRIRDSKTIIALLAYRAWWRKTERKKGRGKKRG
jgi:ADP-ribose pyrophosphatase